MSKQVNTLMSDALYTHLLRWISLQYFTTGERLTVSEVVRRAVTDYLGKS